MSAPAAHPYWYKDAILYEVNVRAFSDSNADGLGDFPGLTAKLDYLKDLGVTALWLLPFYPSPMRDDGYDIADYTGVHPAYGTLADFERFLEEAHRRDLRVITEVVLNHTSDRHPWFERARRAPAGSAWRDFYVWSDTPDKYPDARVIFKDFEHSNWSWDPVARAYYWHRFYSHQPDLNYENPAVREAVFGVIDFWLDKGVDGLRLDAVPYLYEREATSCENLPETHAVLKELRRHVDATYKDRMLLAEANQWPEDAAAYFGSGTGDECHTAFHFPLMPRMFMALQTEDRFPILDILEQTPALPESGQWALFLRNHDELTLEMVTDEERDYMYRMYADDPQARINLGIRRRLAPLLSNNRRKIELMNSLLLSLPGTPVLYYGDEIGMGDNFYLGDRNGVRTPMQWSSDRNAGFSQANAQRLYLPVIIDPEYHYAAVNVEVQQNNPNSLLWWMKRLIAFRKRTQVFGRGTLEPVLSENRKVLSFVRRYKNETMLVVANLSRFVQHAELTLTSFAGFSPVEALGRAEFPLISEAPYPLTLGPHGFYWFSLEKASLPAGPAAPALEPSGAWEDPLALAARPWVEEALLGYLRRSGFAESGSRSLRYVHLQELLPLEGGLQLASIGVESMEGPLRCMLPLGVAWAAHAAELRRQQPAAVIARLSGPQGEGVLYDAVVDKASSLALLSMAAESRRLRTEGGEIVATSNPGLKERLQGGLEGSEAVVTLGERGAVSIACGRQAIKLFRRLDSGVSPDLELSRFLTEKGFPNILPLLGALELVSVKGEPATIGVIYGTEPGQGDAWKHTLDALGRFYEVALASGQPPPEECGAHESVGPYLRDAELLGRRTAELHLTLAGDDRPAFVPEPFTWQHQRSIYQSLRTLTREVSQLLRRQLNTLPAGMVADAQRIIDFEEPALRASRLVYERKITALRLRCHGDFHLGRALYTGKDFLITGFEGEAFRSLSERRIKRTPLRDVAGMLRSFDYAAYTALLGREVGALVRPEDLETLQRWAQYWTTCVGATYLAAYLERAAGGGFLPPTREETDILLDVYLRERAYLQLANELKHRPGWALIALKGLARLLAAGQGRAE